jgi:hypothetical protein
MAYLTRKVPDAMIAALVTAHNARQEASVAALFHADKTQKTTGHFLSPVVANDTVTAANGTDMATAVTLVNEIKAVVGRHFADSLAHNTATSAQITIADATNTATAVTLANDLKAKYTVHITAANVHFNNDGTNTVTNADATDLATLNVLINEIKGDINAHVISAPAGSMIRLTPG